ncbi:MAG: ABC transporter substrate-binding protein [Actinobacteria bacterium]|nr:MAG: ABC transporter substrate-binding protein [Actinomycetota bacterium]
MIGRALTLIVTLTLGTLAVPLTVDAQQAAKVPRIGVLHAGTPAGSSHFFEAFKQGMREHGYVEGQSIILERRFGEARVDRISEIAAELVRIKVDVIVTSTDVGIAAVKQQTQTIPIVMANSTDPVATGFVASLARPGGNVTGFSMMVPELSAKRLELLKEAAPRLSRIAIIWNPEETQSAARSLCLQLQSVEVSGADDFNRAFSAVTNGRAEALIVSALNPPVFANRGQIASLAQRNRLPSMYGLREFADAGGLMSYGPNTAELWRRAATYVDKILKGAKPGDLSVEQPTKFELVINLKTAKALGLTIPPPLLRRADHVIQ